MDKTLEMLLVKALDMCRQGILPAETDLIRSLIGAMGEAEVVKLTDGEITNKNFDVYGRKKYVGGIEVKTAHVPTAGTLGAWSLMCKRGKCDYFAIVDMSNLNINPRISMIPHDAMFKYLDTPNKRGNTPDYFKWSLSYNVTDKKCVEATRIFLEYEVK